MTKNIPNKDIKTTSQVTEKDDVRVEPRFSQIVQFMMIDNRLLWRMLSISMAGVISYLANKWMLVVPLVMLFNAAFETYKGYYAGKDFSAVDKDIFIPVRMSQETFETYIQYSYWTRAIALIVVFPVATLWLHNMGGAFLTVIGIAGMISFMAERFLQMSLTLMKFTHNPYFGKNTTPEFQESHRNIKHTEFDNIQTQVMYQSTGHYIPYYK